MCVGVPGRIVSIDNSGLAVVDFQGTTREVSVALLEDPLPGDYVMVHAGFAQRRMEPAEADETLELLRLLLDDSDP